MKKALLAVIALIFSLGLHAQCVISYPLTDPGIVPDSATGLAHGAVGVSYSDTLQFRVPPDTVISAQTFIINWVRIDSILGMPPGFGWSTSECASCLLHHFNGGTDGCLLIFGPALFSVGTWPLDIRLTANGTHPIIGTITLPDTNTDYSIVIDSAAGISITNTPVVFDVFQNYPNPFNVNGQTEITFTAPSAGKANFSVYDLLGREIIHRNVDAVAGTNKIQLSSRYFKAGIYFYKVNFKNKSITRKMIVTAKP